MMAAAASIAAIIRAPRLRRGLGAVLVIATAFASFAATYLVQRHYFAKRYLVGERDHPDVAALYRWAQSVSGARIALYGIATSYPLYGARVTNRVDYLGIRKSDGSFVPIKDCLTWRQTINRGHYRYIVITPAPTGQVPVSWTSSDHAAVLLLHPARDKDVFRLGGPLRPEGCSSVTS